MCVCVCACVCVCVRVCVRVCARLYFISNKYCPKHAELIQSSIKLLLLHLAGHLCYSPKLMMHGQHKSNCFTFRLQVFISL